MKSSSTLPLLTSGLVVCRKCLNVRGVKSLSHVLILVDEFLNSFSSHWTLSRACTAGLSRRGLEYLAARDSTWEGRRNALYTVVAKNHLHVLQWLHEWYPDETLWGHRRGFSIMNKAAEQGHLTIVQWLHANRKVKCTTFAMNIAAAHGRLEMVQWLHQNRLEGCTKQAMDDAAENGHLAVVKWLHCNRKEGCTEDAMDHAAGNGHLEILRFLHEHRREGCTAVALNLAAASGHMNVVQWLCANRKEGQIGTALRAAAENGHLVLAEWLYDEVYRRQNRSESTIRNAVLAANTARHTDVAELLERKLKRQRT